MILLTGFWGTIVPRDLPCLPSGQAQLNAIVMDKEKPALGIRNNPDKHRFEVDVGDGTFAIADYNLLTGKIVFTHTEVPKGHEGQGIGSKLIRFALDFAREQGLEVIPICPFFAAYMKKHAEVQDLLDPSYRSALGLGAAEPS